MLNQNEKGQSLNYQSECTNNANDSLLNIKKSDMCKLNTDGRVVQANEEENENKYSQGIHSKQQDNQ